MTEDEIRKEYGISDMVSLKNENYQIKKSHLIWGIVLYGIIMWAAGFIWAGVVL